MKNNRFILVSILCISLFCVESLHAGSFWNWFHFRPSVIIGYMYRAPWKLTKRFFSSCFDFDFVRKRDVDRRCNKAIVRLNKQHAKDKEEAENLKIKAGGVVSSLKQGHNLLSSSNQAYNQQFKNVMAQQEKLNQKTRSKFSEQNTEFEKLKAEQTQINTQFTDLDREEKKIEGIVHSSLSEIQEQAKMIHPVIDENSGSRSIEVSYC